MQPLRTHRVINWTAGFRWLLCLLALNTLALSEGQAQESQTGIIRGRVLNRETGKYIANAVVRVEGTQLRSVTGNYGEFRLDQVPAGTVDLRAEYLGREPITETVAVRPGETTLQNFTFSRGSREEEVFELAEFEVVASDFQTGSEIAIAEERYAPNIKNVVSSEAFGDVPEGNIGEFVKFIPGVLIGYGGEYSSGADATEISVRGFPPHQTSVMVDGVPIANAQPGSLTRAVGLDMLSINNASRVEVTKVPTPDMPNDSIGGSINLVSKSAFEYAKPTFFWRAYLSMNSEKTDLFKKTPGPGNEKTYKVLPGFDLTYAMPVSDHFGVTFTANSSNQYNENRRADITWDQRANGNLQHPDGYFMDARHPFIRDIEITDRPRNSHRHSASAKIDYRPWDGHLFTANYQVSLYDSTDSGRILALAPRSEPVDWGEDYVIGGPGTVAGEQIVRSLDKEGETHSAYLKWRYDKGPWNISVHLSRSESDSSLVSTENGHFSELELQLSGEEQIIFEDIRRGIPGTVTVLDDDGNAIDYTQLDNYQLASDGSEPLYVRAGNTDTSEEVNVYKADLRRELDFLPFEFFELAVKVGVYREEQIITKEGRGTNYRYQYIGPIEAFDATAYEDTVYTGIEPGYGFPAMQWADLSKLYKFYRENPDWWSDDADDTTNGGTGSPGAFLSVAANNYIEFVNTNKHIKETQDAWYGQLEGEFFNHRLTVVTGIRGESSKRDGYGPYQESAWNLLKNPDGSIYKDDPFFPNGVNITSNRAFQFVNRDLLEAAGITWDRVLTANSLEAAQLQYIAKYPISDKTSGKPSYSAHASYDITDNLVAKMAYARTYGQIDYEDGILARTNFNADPFGQGGYISVGNPDLEPWAADNWDFTLSYYTNSGGKLSVAYFLKNVDNFHIDQSFVLNETNYEEILPRFGIVPAPYLAEDWILETTVNGEGVARTTGWEFEISHSLEFIGFLGEWGSRFYVYGNYTMKEYSSNQDASGALGATSDDFASGGINYQGDRLYVRLNATYRDTNIMLERSETVNLLDQNGATAGTAVLFPFEPSEIKLDLNMGYRFYKDYEFFLNARNITDEPRIRKWMDADGTVLPGYASVYDINRYGVQYTFGIRGTF